jgi:hypothetical protein
MARIANPVIGFKFRTCRNPEFAVATRGGLRSNRPAPSYGEHCTGNYGRCEHLVFQVRCNSQQPPLSGRISS